MRAAVTPILTVESLTHRYPTASAAAIEDVSFSVEPGEIVAVVGPSGCGKSTLLAAVAGLLPGAGDAVQVSGDPVRGPHPHVGVVFQEDSTFPWRTTRRNVEYGLQVRGCDRATRQRVATEMLALVGLSDVAESYPSQLSGGMKARVAIARTLCTEPALLLMDEPFGALDEQTRTDLGEELLRIAQRLHQTVLIVTHNISEAVLLADRVVLLTGHPGHVLDVVDIDLPRPRGVELLGTPHFGELVASVFRAVRTRSPENQEA